MKRIISTTSFMLLLCLCAGAQGIFVETESFSDKGGWSLDQQFTDLMGSPYLIAHGYGKRESRRLLGDYILKQDDVEKQVFHEDASFTINWHFDLHFPDPKNTRLFPGNEFIAATKTNPIPLYAVPYRTLYSRNINNMFMAGRNISTTHVTLGSTRLMRNIGMMGEVVGMAASICRNHSALPRDVYQKYLPELKELMKKGAARTDIELPDNQHFNEGEYLKKPKDIKF